MFKPHSSFIVLYTTDIEKTHLFFNKLNTKITQYEKDKVVLKLGSLDLHFILYSTEPAEAYKYIAEPKGYGQGIIFYIETDDIETAEKKIVHAGGVVKASVFKNHWGYRELLFEDPNGYKFALYQEI